MLQPLMSRREIVVGITLVALVMAPIRFGGQRLVYSRPDRALIIAHRGASGYAPEHTLTAYKLAIEQGADFVEQDLQLTKDGVLICLHDPDLSRTTNVADVFPNRARELDIEEPGHKKRGWYTIDFTLEEIKTLDAGSWFNRANPFAAQPSYAGLRVPTMEEAIRAVGNRAGLYIELKHYPFYKSAGMDAAAKLAQILDRHGFNSTSRSTKILIQSFSKESLLRMRQLAPRYSRIQLLPMEDAGRERDSGVVTPQLAREVSGYAAGVGPNKSMIRGKPDVETLHAAGLLIHPYTFRGPSTAVKRRPLDEKNSSGETVADQIASEIRRFIELGIDGGFTDYPAIWKKATQPSKAANTSRIHFETRCGWFRNPTPANIWLYDRDGEWTIGVQGGYQLSGDWEWPKFKRGQWVITNSGGYGYGCACLQLRVDLERHNVMEIKKAYARPLAECQNDRYLKRSMPR
jgi:glycerophosphoryl diester phosphodiesterase